MDPRIAALLAWIPVHDPLDTEERAALHRLGHHLRSTEDAFARTTLPTHVTASAVVVDEDDGTVLLHLHRRLGRWLQPGGHVEPGEHPQDAAVRETIEETGVAVRHPDGGPVIAHLDEHPGPDEHVHLDLRYLLLADRRAPPIGRAESTGTGPGPTLRWVSPAEARLAADRSLTRALEAVVRRRG